MESITGAPSGGEVVPTSLLSLASVGLCILVVWLVTCAARPAKFLLHRCPGRPNRLSLPLVLGVFLAMWLASGLASMALKAAFLPADMPPAAREHLQQRLSLAAQTIASVVWLAAGLAAAAVGFRHGLGRGMGLSARRWLNDTVRGVLGYLAVLPVCLGLLLAMTWLFLQVGIEPKYHMVLRDFRTYSPGWKVLAVFSTVVVAPLAEEVFFRGLVQSILRQVFRGPWVAILGAAVFFAAMHFDQPQAIPSLFALAVALGYNYERTGRLLAPILMHATFNAVNIAVWQAS
ncbi:MAG: CPBP family intramembrane metalloprotease [Planctomycetes bacterium]|nr:CPBP family intramembrane metalloprotease [Planctomycetota bacterium]